MILAAINNFADITKDTMTDLIKKLSREASNEKMSNAQDNVLTAMATMSELTEDEKVILDELLVDNHNKLSLFLLLVHGGKIELSETVARWRLT